MKCTRASFEGVNPLPGEDKVCMCDEHNMQTAEEQNNIVLYWRMQIEAARIKE
jgi:hypothetical protein